MQEKWATMLKQIRFEKNYSMQELFLKMGLKEQPGAASNLGSVDILENGVILVIFGCKLIIFFEI